MYRLSERRRLGKAQTRRRRGKRADVVLTRGHHSRWWAAGLQLLLHTKSEWGPGPWQDEPDRLEWRHASGLPCWIVRNCMGSLCGYVGVPPEHPFYMRAPDDCNVEVHGGLNYCGHMTELGKERDIWWLGFDCAHCSDLMPLTRGFASVLPIFLRADLGQTYRTLAYVRTEVERLALQVAEAADG